jgi:hypothetical protein
MSVCVCEWRGEFNRVVLVVQLGLIFHFTLNPEQRRVFQLLQHKNKYSSFISINFTPIIYTTLEVLY